MEKEKEIESLQKIKRFVALLKLGF